MDNYQAALNILITYLRDAKGFKSSTIFNELTWEVEQ